MRKKDLADAARKNFADDLDIAATKALKTLKEIATKRYDETQKDFPKLVASQVEACKLLLVTKLKAGQPIGAGDDIGELYESFKIEYKTNAKIISERPDALAKVLDRNALVARNDVAVQPVAESGVLLTRQ